MTVQAEYANLWITQACFKNSHILRLQNPKNAPSAAPRFVIFLQLTEPPITSMYSAHLFFSADSCKNRVMSHINNTFLPSGRIDLGTGDLALGPLDGRYASATAPLTNYLSEAALNRDRIGSSTCASIRFFRACPRSPVSRRMVCARLSLILMLILSLSWQRLRQSPFTM